MELGGVVCVSKWVFRKLIITFRKVLSENQKIHYGKYFLEVKKYILKRIFWKSMEGDNFIIERAFQKQENAFRKGLFKTFFSFCKGLFKSVFFAFQKGLFENVVLCFRKNFPKDVQNHLSRMQTKMTNLQLDSRLRPLQTIDVSPKLPQITFPTTPNTNLTKFLSKSNPNQL